MAIVSIITQPSVDDLKAAYRPIVFVVRANRTDGNPKPPVVFCDIYVDGVFYKSQAKTQYFALNVTDSEWQFDIQDACQEVLQKKLAGNAIKDLTVVPEIMKSFYCRFRSSGITVEGFTQAEGTEPVQATGTYPAVSGTGTQSNTFFVANATLQHEQNQLMPMHLNAYKKRTWSSNAFPLSHRPEGYKVGQNDADVFPFIYLDDTQLQCLRINYRFKGQTSFHTKKTCYSVPCNTSFNNLTIAVWKQSPDEEYPIYLATWDTDGDPVESYTMEMSLDGGATWTPVTIVTSQSSSELYYSLDNTNTSPVNHKLRLTPNGGPGVLACSTAIGTYLTCVPVAFVGIPTLPPHVSVGVPFLRTYNLTGTAPFTLTSIAKPSWLTISVSGNEIHLSGTPVVEGEDIEVSFVVNNCSDSTVSFSDEFDAHSAPSYITGSDEPTVVDACKTRYEFVVTATVGNSLTISAVCTHGIAELLSPLTPVTLVYSSPLTYINDLANAAGAGYSEIVFTVVNNTTSVTSSVTIQRHNNGSAC